LLVYVSSGPLNYNYKKKKLGINNILVYVEINITMNVVNYW